MGNMRALLGNAKALTLNSSAESDTPIKASNRNAEFGDDYSAAFFLREAAEAPPLFDDPPLDALPEAVLAEASFAATFPPTAFRAAAFSAVLS
jgi:hypothetical protein